MDGAPLVVTGFLSSRTAGGRIGLHAAELAVDGSAWPVRGSASAATFRSDQFLTTPEVRHSMATYTQTRTHTGRAGLLRRALQLDAAASGLLGIVLAAASGPVGRLFDLPASVLLGTGLVLVVWAAVVGWLGTRAEVPRRGAVAVIVLNLLWAIDSVVLLVTGWIEPNGLGLAFVLAQAAAVLVFAELQYAGLRRLRRP
jgi:hypothetical protein